MLLTFLLAGCGEAPSTSQRLRIAATSIPHAEILEVAKADLVDQGVELEIVVMDDYQIPNRALADGEVDANFFQHQPFLNSQMEQFGYQLHSFVTVHLEPMALYGGKVHSLEALPEKGVVALPSDPTNQARALLLLEKEGIIELHKRGIEATVFDISKNPKQLTFLEIDAPLLARTLADVDIAAITTNFALQAEVLADGDAFAIEAIESPYANVVVVRKGDEEQISLRLLKEVLTSEKMKKFIQKQYQGAIIPAFE